MEDTIVVPELTEAELEEIQGGHDGGPCCTLTLDGGCGC